MHTGRPLLFIGLTLFLLGCGSETEKGALPATRGSRASIDITESLTHVNFAVLLAVPSPLLGPYVASYLTLTGGPPYQSALHGIEAQMALTFKRETQDEEAITLLDHLGSALEVRIADLLNRSTNREKTLNEFINTLRTLLDLAKSQETALDSRMDTLSDERRASRRKASDLQHELNQALRERNYSLAGSRQEDLTDAEKSVAELDARVRHLQSIIDIYEDFQKVGTERLYAIEQNRGPLIAGVYVNEVPGIEDIGVINSGRRSRYGGGSLFDPGPATGN